MLRPKKKKKTLLMEELIKGCVLMLAEVLVIHNKGNEMATVYMIITRMNGSSYLAIHYMCTKCNIDTVKELYFRFLELV